MAEPIFDLKFSRLMVGTVQFGLSYGIANRTGQPSFKEVCRILARALAHGVTTLDTAAAYGESEAVLGRALKEIGALDNMIVVSKVRHLKSMREAATPENVRFWIRDSVTSSLARLGLESLPVCLFHDAADREFMEMLADLKREGLIQHTGVSLGTPDELGPVICPTGLKAPGVEAVQVPGSLLDQRVLRSGNLARAARAGVAVFLRSIFLQGLLLLPEAQILPQLQEVAVPRRGLKTIAAEAGISMAEMALRFGLSLPGVTAVLAGVETQEQMAANAAMAARGPLPPDMMAAIQEAVPDLSMTSVLNPAQWPGAKR